MGYQVDEIYQGSSDHLKAEDLGNDMLTLTMAGVESKTFDNGDIKLVVSFQDHEKSLVLNATNARSIRDITASGDTDAWFGKQIMLFAMPVDFGGKQTMGIRVRAPQGNTQQPPVQNGNNPPPVTDPNDYGAARG